MKKTLLIFCIGSIAILGAFNFSITKEEQTLSYLSLANVEALANTESTEKNKTRCSSSILPLGGSRVVYCGVCITYDHYKGAHNSFSYGCP